MTNTDPHNVCVCGHHHWAHTYDDSERQRKVLGCRKVWCDCTKFRRP